MSFIPVSPDLDVMGRLHLIGASRPFSSNRFHKRPLLSPAPAADFFGADTLRGCLLSRCPPKFSPSAVFSLGPHSFPE